ncbi:MAG: MotA/TolQ/ExbB proton channel family protein [Kiritimatiellae bacterium]|jgi:biopolymer transport protein ExbB|nr:MotA/TolQ/ExbB proton channel family protein [Kiritimatiellia bacterium]
MKEISIQFSQAWEYGGWIMWVMAALSVIAFAIFLIVLITQRRQAICPQELISEVFDLLNKRKVEDAYQACLRKPCPFSAVALEAMSSGAKSADSIATIGSHVSERLNAVVDYLADIAAIAPLVGLLGTVLGMFSAFGGIASDVAANARPVVLAQGVSQAIVTTIFGLVVAIPCIAIHAFLRRRTAKRISELETLSDKLIKVFK